MPKKKKKLFTVIQIFKLLYVLILWISSQKNFSSPCRFTGFEVNVCSGVCVPNGFVCPCAFALEEVRCEDLSVCHFQKERKRLVDLLMFVVRKLIPK